MRISTLIIYSIYILYYLVLIVRLFKLTDTEPTYIFLKEVSCSSGTMNKLYYLIHTFIMYNLNIYSLILFKITFYTIQVIFKSRELDKSLVSRVGTDIYLM